MKIPSTEIQKNLVICGKDVFYSIMRTLRKMHPSISEFNRNFKDTEFEYRGVKFSLNPFLPDNVVVTNDPDLKELLQTLEQLPKPSGVH